MLSSSVNNLKIDFNTLFIQLYISILHPQITMSRHAHFTAGQTTPPVEKAEEETRDGQATPAVEEHEPIPFSRSVAMTPLVDD